MPAGLIRCGQCEQANPAEVASDWMEGECPACKVRHSVMTFPALRGARPSRNPEARVAGEGQAACYFHAHKPASVPCDVCGRFLCRLCDFDFEGGHFCATCLESAQSGKGGGKPADLMREEIFIPQNLALMLAVYMPLSLIGLYVTFITAPAAIYVSLRYWNRREGLQVRSRWPYVISLALGIAQILALAGLAWFIFWVIQEVKSK